MNNNRRCILLLLILITVFSTLSYAQSEQAPSEESFIQAWENHITQSDTTFSLEKTDQDNIYNFKSKLFDYDGQLRILNVLIKKSESYDQKANARTLYYEGVAEVELLNNGHDLEQSFPQSYNEWILLQRLYFVVDENRWVSPKEYYDLLIKNSESAFTPANYGVYMTYAFFFFLFVLMIRNIIFHKNRQKKLDDLLKQHLENQYKQIELLEKISKDVSK